MSDEIPRKKVDEDWKKRAAAEREADAVKGGFAKPAPAGAPAADAGAAPAANEPKTNPHFPGLVESLASQALMFMGAMRDPMTGQAHQDLHQAQAMIELLGMLEEKTKGNLSKEEAAMLKQVLDEVRVHYVRMASPPPPRPGPRGPMMGNSPRG
jgi:hypothetical protein